MPYRIAFSLIRGMGIELARQFLDVIPDEQTFFTMSEEELCAITGSKNKILEWQYRQGILEKAKRELDFIDKNDISTTYFTDSDYPKRLLQCVDAPLMLFGKGYANLDSQHVISIVGTRHATIYGKGVIEEMIKGISQIFPDTVVVSGLAYGVDIAAHQAAVSNKLSTVEVLAHGLNTIYPAQHRSFAISMIKDSGMLLTDYTSQDVIHRANFLARNRIVAGLSDCTIVVESAVKGGAMVTASLAMEYNRDVFAVPGRTTDPYSAGCNTLIRRNKAALYTDVEALVEAMRWEVPQDTVKKAVDASLFPDITPDEEPIYNYILNNGTVHINTIRSATGIAMHELMSKLVDMEFRGVIKSMPGSVYSL